MQLDGMTQERWGRMTPRERDEARDLSELHPRLTAHEGWRVEVTYSRPYVCMFGEERLTERFRVGRSTGWRPCSLALHNARSMGGHAINRDAPIKSVRRIARQR